MARISTYNQDSALQDGDRLLGTDSTGAGTTNFTLDSLREYMNLGIDIRQETSPGYIPSVTNDGTNVEQSRIRTLERTLSMTTLTVPRADFNIYVDTDGNGALSMRFENPDLLNITLESFVGATFSGVTSTAGTATITGTIEEILPINGRNWSLDAQGDTVFSFRIISSDYTQARELVFNTITFTFPTGMVSVRETSIEGNTFFEGESTFNNDVALNSRLNVDVLDGSVNFGGTVLDASADGLDITGGELDVNSPVVFSRDLTLDNGLQDGEPDLIVRGGDIELHTYTDADGNEVGGSLRRFNSVGAEQPPIENVIGNGGDGIDQGLLTSLQVGNRNWHLPIASSSVAQVVPGLLEELSPADQADVTGQFFYGTDMGTFAVFRSDVASNPAPFNIPASVTRVPVGAMGTVTDAARERNTRLVSAFGNVPGNQRLFFVAEPALPVPAMISFRFAQTIGDTITVTGGGATDVITIVAGNLSGPYPLTNISALTTAPATITATVAGAPIATATQNAAQTATIQFQAGLQVGDVITVTQGLLADSITITTANMVAVNNLPTITAANAAAISVSGLRGGVPIANIPGFTFVPMVGANVTLLYGVAAGDTVVISDGTNTDTITATANQTVFPLTTVTGTVTSILINGAAPTAFIYTPETITHNNPQSQATPNRIELRDGVPFGTQLRFVASFTPGTITITTPPAAGAVINVQGSNALQFDTFTGDGTTTVFNLMNVTEAAPAVTIAGITQTAGFTIIPVQMMSVTLTANQTGQTIFNTPTLTGLPVRIDQIVPSVFGISTIPINGATIQFAGGLQVGDIVTVTEGAAVASVTIDPNNIVAANPLPGITVTDQDDVVVALTRAGVAITPVPAFTFTPNTVLYETAVASADATDGDTVTGSIFEVTNYDAIDYDSSDPNLVVGVGELEFSRVGVGNLQVNTDRFTISSDLVLPNLPFADPTAQNLIFRDPTTGEISTSPLTSVTGAQSQVRYCPEDDPTNLTNLREIRFEGASASNGILTVGGGRYSAQVVNGEAGGAFTANATVAAGDYAVLGRIAAQQTLSLPLGTPGDTVRVINASTFGTPAQPGLWRVIPDATQFIATGIELILNDRTANFDLVYANDTLGWMIMD